MLKPRRITKRVGEFVGVDDNGWEHFVIEYQDFFENHLRNGRVKWIAGLKDFRLQDGSTLYQMGRDTFALGETGLTIRRIVTMPLANSQSRS